MRWQLLSILFFIIFLLACGNPSTASELGRHDIPPTFWSAAGFLLLLFCLFLAGVLFFWCHPQCGSFKHGATALDEYHCNLEHSDFIPSLMAVLLLLILRQSVTVIITENCLLNFRVAYALVCERVVTKGSRMCVAATSELIRSGLICKQACI